jgi:hypothetical protein
MSGSPAHVVVLGCGRSGTSIVGELLEDLGVHEYHSEPAFEALAGLDWTRPQAIKVPREPTNGPVTPGLSVDLATLLAVVPEPRLVIWQVRHPLDAICSLRVGIGDGWTHHPRPPDWQEWVNRPLLDRCAHHWCHINGAGYDAVAEVATVHRFEDMIANPADDALAVGAMVGVDTKVPSIRAGLDAWARRVQDTNNDQFVEAQTSRRLSRPDHIHRVERWRENLTPDEVDHLWPIVAPLATRFGY